MISDLTVRTRYGAVDLVPFLRRDAGEDLDVCDWEKHPAALVLHGRGWTVHRVASAVGLSHDTVQEIVEGRYRPPTLIGERSAAERSRREARRAERVMVDGQWVHPNAPHGSPSSQRNWGCYCDLCTVARRVDQRKRRAVQRYQKQARREAS